jgi:PKD repeat protein
MRHLLFTLLFSLFLSGLLLGKGYEVTFHQPETGIYELLFTLGDYAVEETVKNGVAFSQIDFEGSVFTQLKGFAELPFINASVKLSPDKNVNLKIIEGEYTEYQLNYPMIPSRGVIYRDQDPSAIPYEISPSSFRDNWHPQDIATSTSPYIIKDLRGTTVYVYPFRYNAVANTLRVYQTVTVRLVEDESPADNPLEKVPTTILREMDAVYKSLFINYADYSKNLTIGDYGDILVLYTSRDETAIQPYIEWKQEKGYNVFTEMVPTGTNVKTNIQNAYNANNNILYVLLVGDWADIKSDLLSGYAPMDPQLGCVVGTDQHPDIAIGRFSANSASDVTIQVNKTIAYEKDPVPGATWYKAALGVASNEGPGDDGEYDHQHVEVIHNNKLAPYTYNSFSTAYQPSATAQMVTTAITNGVSVINYTGHGSNTSWSTTGYSNTHIAGLTNGNKLPVIFSVACVNGAFHSGTCFAEAWLRKDNGGAVIALMATINQPWNPPMRGQDYFNDILTGGYDYSLYPGQNGISTSELRTTIGSIIFNGLVLMTTESGTNSDWETAKTWITFGDPSLQMRTDTPGNLTLSGSVVLVGAPFATTVTGPNGPVEGAMVCLSQDGEFFKGITDATGSVSFSHNLLPGNATLVVTAYNMETIYDQVTVVPPGGAYVVLNSFEVNDAAGNNNGQADYGETVLLDVVAENVGADIASGVTATLSTDNPYITITDSSYTFGDIPAGSVVTGTGAFEVYVHENAPDGHMAILQLEFNSTNKNSWVSSLTLPLHAAVLEMSEYVILDVTGNNNGKIDPGETVTISIQLINSGSSDSYNVTAQLTCTDPYITINQNTQIYGNINAGATAQQNFSVSANIATPAGYPVTFELEISGDLSLSASASFTEVVGQIPVLIIDLDGNNNSANMMLDAISAIEISAEYTTSFPPDLNLYSSIFLCLGIYPDNHVLTSGQGQTLVNFLNNGGNLYMEGGDTWYYDTQTPVHNMFGINPVADGSGDLSTIIGQAGTFTEGMSFSYSGDNNYIDRIQPAGTAYLILENTSPNYGTAVANDPGSYKTIGVSHEFGGLVDGNSPSTKEELFGAYLEFFGFTNILQAMFFASATEICEGDIVEFYDMSSGNPVSWSWTFEGGMPGSSAFQNPMAMYPAAGSYDVTLTVSDGVDSHSITLEDFILVNICTGVEEINQESISIHPNPGNGIFNIEITGMRADQLQIRVLNTIGNEVYFDKDLSFTGNLSTTIDLSRLHKGLYFVVIETPYESMVRRIIIR